MVLLIIKFLILKPKKSYFLKMESEPISLYKTSLVNILISFYKIIQATIYAKSINNLKALELYKDAQELIRFSIANFRDSKIINICKTNIALINYNMAAIFYLMKQNNECLSIIRKLIETITNDFFSFVDNEVVHRIFLLKCYCHINNDNTLANHAAKMAIELSKASLLDPQFNGLIIHIESQMFQISSFDDREEIESVANSNADDDIILPSRNHENVNYSLKIIENSPKGNDVSKLNIHNSFKKVEEEQNKDLLNPDIDSQDALMSCKSLNNNDLELLNPELNKSKSILGGALGRKISSTKPKVDSRRKGSVFIRSKPLIDDSPTKHKKQK